MYSWLKDFGTVKQNKVYTNVVGKNGKIAYVGKRTVSLQDFKSEYGSNVKILTPENIVSGHLGKVKCSMKFKTEEELKQILIKYFSE